MRPVAALWTRHALLQVIEPEGDLEAVVARLALVVVTRHRYTTGLPELCGSLRARIPTSPIHDEISRCLLTMTLRVQSRKRYMR
jgi:hypothetical protein